ncbi:MAG: putative rane protein [Paenibacillaceae bacterium]|jgi:uncharacterized membrane protein|nr:putative rane protein [Paenibacillaceae bacterium]
MEVLSGYLGYGSPAYVPLDDWPGLLFYFVLYAWMGWMLEHGYHRAVKGRFAGEGFLAGPWKPMYGFAPVLLLSLTGPDTPLWVVAIVAFAVPTVVEYISGLLLLRLFHKQYWSYAECRCQLGSLVCLRFSFYWTLLGFVMIYALQPAAAGLYRLLQPVWQTGGWQLVLAALLLDVGWTVVKSARALKPAAK